MYPHSNPPYPNNYPGTPAAFVPPGLPPNPGSAPSGVPIPGYPGQYPSAGIAPTYPPSPNYPHPNLGPTPPYPGTQYPASRPEVGFVNSAPPLSAYPGPGYPSQPPLPVPGQSYYPNPTVTSSPVGLGYPAPNTFAATGGTSYPPLPHGSSPGYPGSNLQYGIAPQAPVQSTLYPQSHLSPVQQTVAPLNQAHSSPSSSPRMSAQPYYETPTIRDGPYDPMADAQVLRKAMKGFGTDEKAIISVLAKRTNNQRLQIANSFKASFGKDLISDLKSETGGKFEDVLVAMMTPRYDYMAQRLHDAISGLGTKEMILIDILCSASNEDLRWIQHSYARLYNNALDKDIISDTSGHFRRLLVSLCVAQRSEDTRVDPGLVHQDAQALYSAGMKKWGTDESVFNSIMATRSYPHLREVFHEYEKVSGQDIERTINAEFSGDIKDAMNAIVKSVKNRASYFAQRLRDAMKGMGTNDSNLIFLIITRAEVDLENIKQEYYRLYNKSLADDIKSDTSGDYQKTLLAMVG